jgi:hypothetical protein
MTDRDVPTVAQIAADALHKLPPMRWGRSSRSTCQRINRRRPKGSALQGALVLSLGYILQRGTQGMPEVQRMRMLYNMIDKIRADQVKLTVGDVWPATSSAWQADGLQGGASAPNG